MKVQAHRGASKERPENTMAAFRRAAELRADGIELDVHLLKDGSLVVHHDSDLGRCETVKGKIYDFSGKNIQSFSIGEWFSPKYKRETIPFFQEVLDFLKANNLFLNVEIKAESGFLNDIADRVVLLLNEYNMVNRCIISSFNHYVLKEIKEKYPQYKTGVLYVEDLSLDIVAYCQKHQFDAIHPYYRNVSRELVERCHKSGISVNVWTVDSPADILRMMEYGVDRVISNDVATAVKVISR